MPFLPGLQSHELPPFEEIVRFIEEEFVFFNGTHLVFRVSIKCEGFTTNIYLYLRGCLYVSIINVTYKY